MDLYLFTLCLSFGALLLMAMLGLSHHHAPGKIVSNHGHGHGHHHGPADKLHHHFGHTHSEARGDARPGPGALILAMISPRTLFSLLLGFGATGLALRPLLQAVPVLLFALAVAGGWGFEKFLMHPLWQFLLGFASQPARTLDTLTLEEGLAATDFDASGHGLIAVNLDGQVRQVLGKLPPGERGPGTARVRTGDRLFIRAVNRQRNTCTVSRVAC